jgi:type I restriction enzyme, S subunit
LEGLEVSILPLSEVGEENSKIRIDSGYFTKAALIAEALVEALPNDPLGDLSATFRKGIFDIKADTYVEPGEGVPFIRITDIKTGMIQRHSTAWIDHAAHSREAKTALNSGDLVLSKTAYPAAAIVNVPDCNVSQDTIAVRLSTDGKRHYRTGYIAAYLNSTQGLALMARRFQGNVQQHLSLEDGRSIRIPRLSAPFQDRVHDLVLRVDRQQVAVSNAMLAAENALLAAFGLANWTPPEPLAYTARASDVFVSGRFDAQYFMPAKEQVKQSLATLPGQLLSARVDSIRDQWVPDRAPPAMRVRNYDVTDALVPLLDAEKEPSFASEIGSMKKVFKDGDVAISRLRAYLKEVAVVRTGDDIPSVGSSEFVVLRPKGKAISPETLMVFLRSAPVQTILKWCQDGSQHPRFSERDLLSIPVPDAVATISDQITKIVQDGFTARDSARKLLEAAKRAVEIAVEDGEPAAMAYLDRAEGAI